MPSTTSTVFHTPGMRSTEDALYQLNSVFIYSDPCRVVPEYPIIHYIQYYVIDPGAALRLTFLSA